MEIREDYFDFSLKSESFDRFGEARQLDESFLWYNRPSMKTRRLFEEYSEFTEFTPILLSERLRR